MNAVVERMTRPQVTGIGFIEPMNFLARFLGNTTRIGTRDVGQTRCGTYIHWP